MSKQVMLTAKQALINLILQRPGGHLTVRCTRPLKIHLYNSQSYCQTDNGSFTVWSCLQKLPKQSIHKCFQFRRVLATTNTYSIQATPFSGESFFTAVKVTFRHVIFKY